MSALRAAAWPVCVAALLVAAAAVAGCAAGSVRAQENPGAPLYFRSAEEAVQSADGLLAARDWATLSRAYNLSLTPGADRVRLLDGSFFVDSAQSPTGPAAVTRWLQPFPPGGKFAGAQALGDPSVLPCIWTASTTLALDQGGGEVQRVVREFRLIQTKEGFQFLPPAPTEGATPSAPGSTGGRP